VLATACAGGAARVSSAAAVRADLEKARRAGAARCAPDELALAEASLSSAEEARARGFRGGAETHLRNAGRSARFALERAGSCRPQPGAATAPAPGAPVRPTIVIEKTDADADGVPDLDDRCPDRAGPATFRGCPDTDGDGTPDAEDACPVEAGEREAQGCPVTKDSDRDGIWDDIDRCPVDAEDLDGFQDEDGCPDADNDGDGIVDRSDGCPNTPGAIENRGCPVIGGDSDGDGLLDREDRCPERMGPRPSGCPRSSAFLTVRPDRILLKSAIKFVGAGPRLSRASFPLLGELVQVLTDFPRMRLAIEVHTDASGPEEERLLLSKRRADAVRDYLVAKGIAPDRLEAVGVGSARPIASNKSERGRALNRRVEIRVLTVE
jgi:outer membrane protein OmpA-like peptidoglycan-associated protein